MPITTEYFKEINMAVFEWTDKYSVGVKILDDQHKKLFAMINRLHEAMASGNGNETVQAVLRELVDYTKVHFAAEEKLMQSNHYQSYLQHKVLHDKFATQAQDICLKLRSGKAMVTLTVMNMLKQWLTNHILNEDQRYVPCLSAACAK
jgi:hemerythrin